MSTEKDIKVLVQDIIKRNNIDPSSDVKYNSATQIGEGYASKRISVEICNATETLQLFFKCRPESKDKNVAYVTRKVYETEVRFYTDIYPAYMEFQEERHIQDGFKNAPKCYGTLKNDIIAMENLRSKGFTLFDRSKVMDEDHIKLVLRTFAKFHAISYAMKDQDRETYDRLKGYLYDFFSTDLELVGNDKMIINCVKLFLANLDPVKDQHILKGKENLAVDLLNCHTSAQKNLNIYSIITQGDCWCNNMMFLYPDSSMKNPADMMAIDWQMMREASPVYDLSYFFYTIATRDSLQKLDYYLNIYYDELSNGIKRLGSDPTILYPFAVLKEEWKKYCKSGVAMTFTVLAAMLLTGEEVEQFLVDIATQEVFRPSKFKRQDEYIQRLKAIVEHLIENEYLKLE